MQVVKEHTSYPLQLLWQNRQVTFGRRWKHPKVSSLLLTEQSLSAVAEDTPLPTASAITYSDPPRKGDPLSRSRIVVLYRVKSKRLKEEIIHEAVHVGQAVLACLQRIGYNWNKYNREELVAYVAGTYATDLLKAWRIK